MSCSKPMYEPSKCDGQPCPGDCDLGCPLAYTFDDEDEPQTCDNCKLKGTTKWCNNQVVCRAYKPKDEPQTDCPWK